MKWYLFFRFVSNTLSMKFYLKIKKIAVKYSVLFFLTACVFTSCRKEDKKPSWETGIITPLIKSSLDINNLVTDTLLVANADSSLMLVYENHLYNMNIDSLFSLYDTSVVKIYNLDSISLVDYSVSYGVSLGQVATLIGPPYSTLIIGLHGQMSNIPLPIPIPAFNYSFNADTLFQTMTLDSGTLAFSIYNGFPVKLNNLNYTLTDSVSNTIITTGVIPVIDSGQTVTQSTSLAGKTIGSHLLISISGASTSPTTSPVYIDTTDQIVATLNIFNLYPSTATAVFPAQNLIDKQQFFYVKAKPVMLKEAKIKSGYVTMDLYSTLQDSVQFIYKLPSATLNGIPFEIGTVLPPAPAGGTSHFYQQYDFTGYHLDMSGDSTLDTTNTMYNVFLASVDSTGQMRTLSLTDSMYAYIGFTDLIPSYARGYLGDSTYNIGPAEIDIDIFNKISGGLQLEDVKLSIATENSIGVDAEIKINNLTSHNSHTGNTVALSGSGVGNVFQITRATDNSGQLPVYPTYNTFTLNNANSNANTFISNLPDKLNYALSLKTNPQGNSSNYNDFIYDDHLLEFNLNLEMPLSFIANDLMMSDTFDFKLNEADIARITGGMLVLNTDNGFPFDATIQVYTINQQGFVTDSLLLPPTNVILAASVNTAGRVTDKKRSKQYIPVTEHVKDNLFDTKKMVVRVKFNTKPAAMHVKIYSDYKMDLQLTGDFTYKAN